MIKTLSLIGLAALMSVGAASPSSPVSANAEKDTRIIVELSKGLNGLSEEQILQSQSALLSRIRHTVTNNIEVVQHYSVLNNAVCIALNSNDIEAVKQVPGVKSITIDTLHAKKTTGSTYSAVIHRDVTPDENISATTMQKPSGTADGEGTAVAILDNEFYFRAEHEHDSNCAFKKVEDDGRAIYHEVFSPLADDVKVKYTFDNLTEIVKKTNAKRKNKAEAGQEGSLYFNNKVPFYYDYGGTSTSYGKEGKMDYDVSNSSDYHGSHVSSITAANAPTYKGIAPKAQLVCMKVFTDYKASKTAENLGFGSYTGAYDSCILAALEDCIKLGVDGINMSLGSDLDDFDQNSITLKTLSSLASDYGILTAISAGNSGKSSYSSLGGYANWTRDMVETGIMSSYANNKSVMTIASGQPDQIFYETAIRVGDANIAYDDQIVNREGYDADYLVEYHLADLGAGEHEYQYIPGFGTATDYGDRDVTGKVAIVNRGSTSFADKYKVAVDKGAAALIVINNDPTSSDFNFRMSFGDGFSPTIPCALVLFKDKAFFEAKQSGKFVFLNKEVSINPDARTISTYSTDGATYDYDLKPEITAPGENIRGAVPPQTKEDREATPLSTYQYLSGTSMSAPNYAGAQALVLSNSKAVKDAYADGEVSAAENKAIAAYRSTVDMRLMSTAVPMVDRSANPETNVKVYTSPRMQGAGMVNLDGALSTDVYLEGLDAAGKGIGKSKIVLGNNEDIAKGKLSLSFLAHNESSEARNYSVSLSVMRPAVKNANDIVTRDYNYRGEVESVKLLPGISYYDGSSMMKSQGTASYKDVFKLTRQIEYWTSQADYDADHPEGKSVTTDHAVVMAQGTYYVSSNIKDSSTNVKYDVLPGKNYQSVQDVLIAKIETQKVTVAPGKNTVKIDDFVLTSAQKEAILKAYPYGCAIEGYVELKSEDSHPDLVIPYLGFYSGSDADSTKSYSSAPVVEPFSFEKDIQEVYPSDLVNDITRSLLGKDSVDFGSMMLAGYTKDTSDISTNTILSNDSNFKQIPGFHEVGIDPNTGEYVDDVENNIYVGNPDESNTLIVQQFVLRSVSDNYFTIKNDKGEVVYKSVLQDMLFGDQGGKYPLYKSHVDADYLGAGYVAHRAYAVIPLYNPSTRESFADGVYTLEFSYNLASTGAWVSNSYKLNIDRTNPTVSKITEYKDEDGEARVRIDIDDMKASYAVVGYTKYDVEYDETSKSYYLDLSKQEVLDVMEELGATLKGQYRLYLKLYDMSYGYSGVIIHFEDDKDFSKYQIVQGHNINVFNDFTYKDNEISYIEIDIDGNETVTTIEGSISTNLIIGKQGLSTGALIGIICGCVGGVLLIGGGICVLLVLKKKKSAKAE